MSDINLPTPVRVALIGCGAVSELYYTPALRELQKADLLQVQVLVDPNMLRAQQLGACFPSAQLQCDLTKLSDNVVDLAIIASPPHFHAAQTIELLRKGIAVLCEKPMALNVSEAEAMVAVSKGLGGVLAVGLVRRFLPACQTIQALLAQHVLGDIRSFYFAEGGAFRWPTRSIDYFQRNAVVGGVLFDIGSHLLDLTSWWMGEPSTLRYEDDAMGGIDVNCRIELEFPQGFKGVVRLSRDCELQNRCFIRGTKGWLNWSINESEQIQWQFNGMKAVASSYLHEKNSLHLLPSPGRAVRNFEQSFVAQLQNVLAAVRGKESVFVSGQDSLASMRLLEKCRAHANLMPMKWLSTQEWARAQNLASDVSSC